MQISADTRNSIINPALKVGAATGAAGVLVSGVIAILRGSSNVGLISAITGTNFALLGSSYWASRATILRALQSAETPPLRPGEKVYVGGASGALSGSFVALVTGKPRSVLPGALVWGLAGLFGQFAYNIADARHTQYITHKAERERSGGLGFWDRAMRSRWSPVTRLTTKEYENMLEEKLLVLQAELSLTNEEIEKLERKRKGQEGNCDVEGRT